MIVDHIRTRVAIAYVESKPDLLEETYKEIELLMKYYSILAGILIDYQYKLNDYPELQFEINEITVLRDKAFTFIATRDEDEIIDFCKATLEVNDTQLDYIAAFFHNSDYMNYLLSSYVLWMTMPTAHSDNYQTVFLDADEKRFYGNYSYDDGMDFIEESPYSYVRKCEKGINKSLFCIKSNTVLPVLIELMKHIPFQLISSEIIKKTIYIHIRKIHLAYIKNITHDQRSDLVFPSKQPDFNDVLKTELTKSKVLFELLNRVSAEYFDCFSTSYAEIKNLIDCKHKELNAKHPDRKSLSNLKDVIVNFSPIEIMLTTKECRLSEFLAIGFLLNELDMDLDNLNYYKYSYESIEKNEKLEKAKSVGLSGAVIINKINTYTREIFKDIPFFLDATNSKHLSNFIDYDEKVNVLLSQIIFYQIPWAGRVKREEVLSLKLLVKLLMFMNMLPLIIC